MRSVDQYVAASSRENTKKSYASALRHFEQEWHGLLPATAGSVAQYLADHAASHSHSTLRQRLAALSGWHTEQGFSDPTKDPLVRKTLKGIRELHPAVAKQARPLQLRQIELVDQHLAAEIEEANRSGDRASLLRAKRDRALVLLGFWRGFRSDELSRLQVENIDFASGQGMVCRLTRTKTSTDFQDTEFPVPALSRLCPVAAYEAWIAAAGLTDGPLFRAIDRRGNPRESGLYIDSYVPLLRSILGRAGIAGVAQYSGHSIRRGFAGWAADNGWDVKSLMTYVGWRDMKSAVRYIDASPARMQAMIERGLAHESRDADREAPAAAPALTVEAIPAARQVILRMNLLSASGKSRGTASTRRLLEGIYLEPLKLRRLDKEGYRLELTIEPSEGESFEERIQRLLDDLHKTAEDGRCMLEAMIHDPDADRYWS